MNATTLVGNRLATFLELAESTNSDVLCVQESRLPPLGFESAQKAAQMKGWSAWFVSGGDDAKGNPTHGLATFSRWPARRVKPGKHTGHQALTVAVYVPGRSPVVVYNYYGDPACGVARDGQVIEIVADVATRSEEAVVIGDFNQTPDEHTITDLVIKGIVEEVDLAVGDVEARAQSTRRAGDKEGRHIDYAIATLGMMNDVGAKAAVSHVE